MGFTSGCNSSVPASAACLHSHCALIYLCCFLAPPFHLLFMVFSCSSTSSLFNSFSLLFCCLLPTVYNPSLFPVSLHPCPVLPLKASSLLCSCSRARPGHPWGGTPAPQCVFSPASGHTQGQTGTCPALRRAGAWAQRLNFPCLSALMAGKKSKVKGVRAEPQFKTALDPAESLWVSATELPPLWKKEDAKEKVLLCHCRPW